MKYLLFVLIAALCTHHRSNAAPPNFIIFYTDDHGWSDLGIHGIQKDIKTPRLDALARSGVVAKHGYSTAPQCVPSRAGLLTGRFQARFGVESNQSSMDGFNQQTTIAARLKAAGYVTAQFGKWHLGPDLEITRHGFTHVFAQHSQRPFGANITQDGQDRPMSPQPATSYHIDACSKAASAVIERYKENPFFLYIAYRAPHTPLDAPQHYKDRFPGPMPERRRAALGMIAAIDDGVGHIMDTLEKHGLTSRTLIFFIGDNGAPLKIHKEDSPLDGDAGGWDGSLNEPLNGEKGMLSEGGMHVPFLITWPGTIPGGQTYEHTVSALDVAATTAALAHAKVNPGELDGVNLIPYLTGEKKEPPHAFLAWRWIAQSAIREGDWKLLRGGEREYLYNLAQDLEERHNLASQEPSIAARLRDRLTTWSAQLSPPGLTHGTMAPTWNEYFDHYLEGKPMQPPKASSRTSADPGAIQGWLCRNGTAVHAKGALLIQPDRGINKRQRAFLTHAGLDLPGPITATLTLRAPSSNELTLSWRSREDKDFLPESKTTLPLNASPQPQIHEVSLPIQSRLIHLRLQPTSPAGLEILRIQLRGKAGKQHTWDFAP
jgi:uncharacterized sulfatase